MCWSYTRVSGREHAWIADKTPEIKDIWSWENDKVDYRFLASLCDRTRLDDSAGVIIKRANKKKTKKKHANSSIQTFWERRRIGEGLWKLKVVDKRKGEFEFPFSFFDFFGWHTNAPEKAFWKTTEKMNSLSVSKKKRHKSDYYGENITSFFPLYS